MIQFYEMAEKLKQPINSRAYLKLIKGAEWVEPRLPEKESSKIPAKQKKVLMPEPLQGYIKAKNHDCL